MKKTDIASLALKLMGIYAVVLSLRQLQWVAQDVARVLHSNEQSDVFAASMLPPSIVALTISLTIALGLILASSKIALFITPDHSDEALSGGRQIPSENVQALAFAVLGVFLVIESLPEITRSIGHLCSIDADLPKRVKTEIWRRTIPLIGPVIQFILGILLFFRARGLAKLWRWFQVAGTNKDFE